MKTFLEFINESSLGRVYQHTKDRNIGMITAHRSEHTAEENVNRNRDLEKDIKSHGYGFVHVKGRSIENGKDHPVDEHSYLVVGKKGHDNGELKNFLTKHGEKYGQDSVLHKSHDSNDAYLHGTREGGFPGKGEQHKLGPWHPNRAPMYLSVLRNGKTFAFEEGVDLSEDKIPVTWLEFKFTTPTSFFSRQETEF